jgi:hypothetical protein
VRLDGHRTTVPTNDSAPGRLRGCRGSLGGAEVPVEDRPEVTSEYLRRGVERSGPKTASKQACYYFGMTRIHPWRRSGKPPTTTRYSGSFAVQAS